jgi:dihydroorotate dehydrogenase/uncharacterized Tic20 family protein
MPDWTYQPVFKPILFRLPARTARDLTLAVTGGLAKFPGGTKILDFMGDMRPHPLLAVKTLETTFAGRVGLGGGLVFDKGSVIAFSQFGLGHIEVGPITVSPVVPDNSEIHRDESNATISYPNFPENPGAESVFRELADAIHFLRRPERGVRLGIRLSNLPDTSIEKSTAELVELARKFSKQADFITIDTRWWQNDWNDAAITQLVGSVKSELTKTPLMLLIPPDCPELRLEQLLNAARDVSISGLLIAGGKRQENMRVFGRPGKANALAITKRVSSTLPDKTIIASGGIIEPQDALDFIDAGATLVQLHSGFVFSGPGLAKRINECITFRRSNLLPAPDTVHKSTASEELTQGWVAFTLVAIGLVIAAVAVIVVGLTSVLLPYDESFLGVKMIDLPNINANLLKFMSHDRVTLGGTSLSGAVLFLGLAVCGIRRRMKWAYVAELAGVTAGFLAFFLYLGFKYFDPLHAIVCVVILPFFIWGILRRPNYVPEQTSNLHNDDVWKRSQLGQLMFVLIGAGLLLAGITIAGVGCSTIFVREDLMFMDTTRETLACHDHLLPLIAHDRASFGGCLWAVGTVELLTSLWGFRQGNRWVWWTLLIGGLPGFLAVLGIHFAIGYTDLVHLFPAYIAVIMYVVGLYTSYDYLCRDSSQEGRVETV